MNVAPGRLVTLRFAIHEEGGECLEVSDEQDPLQVVHGSGELPPAVEDALEGQAVGGKVELVLEPEEAYGPYDPEGIVSVPRAQLPEDLEAEPGDWLPILLEPEEGEEDDEEDELEARVVEIDDDAVVLDLNHPYAGKKLRFELEVCGVEPADEEG